tara:strand:- start:3518 stop:4897 length:1380 start_codon:yes stop_codon:yes gene_type:complete
LFEPTLENDTRNSDNIISYQNQPALVAIAGRPNVGKSTLFNRLIGERRAIIANEPGTTRDRVIGKLDTLDSSFMIFDTGGLQGNASDHMEEKIHKQVYTAVEDANIIIFLADGSSGITPLDHEIARDLRKYNKPMLLVINKCESEARKASLSEFFQLGLGDPIPISAIQNQGIYELIEKMTELYSQTPMKTITNKAVPKFAIVGKPNAGKSSILNCIAGDTRAIVDNTPGTTRDAIDTSIFYNNQEISLIDTAGLKKRGSINPGIEKFSSLRAFHAIERSNIGILVIDLENLMTMQDSHIAGYVLDAYKGLVIAINKWDLAKNFGYTKKEVLQQVRLKMHWATYVPILFVSALKNEGITELIETGIEVWQNRFIKIPRAKLNQIILDAMAKHPLPSQGPRHLRFIRAIQKSIDPPSFTLYVSDPKMVHFSYRRYLQNSIRNNFEYKGNPIKLNFERLGS